VEHIGQLNRDHATGAPWHPRCVHRLTFYVLHLLGITTLCAATYFVLTTHNTTTPTISAIERCARAVADACRETGDIDAVRSDLRPEDGSCFGCCRNGLLVEVVRVTARR
jgi:hypothetical protein